MPRALALSLLLLLTGSPAAASRNAFVDADGVLRAHGFVESNAPGQTKIPVPNDFNFPVGQMRWDGAAWVPYTPPSVTPTGPRALRAALPQVFGGSVARMHAVIERFPPLSVVYTMLGDTTLSPDAEGFIAQTTATLKARIGQPTELLTASEYAALKTAADAAGLGALVP